MNIGKLKTSLFDRAFGHPAVCFLQAVYCVMEIKKARLLTVIYIVLFLKGA